MKSSSYTAIALENSLELQGFLAWDRVVGNPPKPYLVLKRTRNAWLWSLEGSNGMRGWDRISNCQQGDKID